MSSSSASFLSFSFELALGRRRGDIYPLYARTRRKDHRDLVGPD
jgi:hypothetical protein